MVKTRDKFTPSSAARRMAELNAAKNISQSAHTRHRSVIGFRVNVVAGFLA